MAVHTIMLDFSLDPSLVKNEASISLLSTNIENVFCDFMTGLKVLNSFSLEKSLVKIYTADLGIVLNLRIYSNGLVTVNMEYYQGEKKEPIMSFDQIRTLEKTIQEKVIEIKRGQAYAPVKRGTFTRFYPTSDERLLEYDIDELLFEETTPFQKIQIVHSKTLGNMLVLDDLQNIAESDLIYTETLMQRGKESYSDKEIVILGGGDGALLYELLKENPKEVIMMEIDEVVMKACAKHMRAICGDVLDRYTAPNYKIIVGDCMKTLEQYIKEGRKFDYIFGDLTDVPISEDCELWKFINKILDMSFRILKPTGKFMTHLTGSASKDALETYLNQLSKIQPPITYTITKAFVPSFLEEWVFCQVSFVNNKTVE